MINERGGSMPIHSHPWFRSLEEAEESNGLIQTRDSVLVTKFKADELSGARVKVVPVAFKRIIRGTVYTAA
jgi:hypothetical protein